MMAKKTPKVVPLLPDPIEKSYPAYPLPRSGWWLVLNDVHIPFHDKVTVQLAIKTAKDYGAKGVLLNGDILDCVTPETRILTWDLRWVRADELQVGDELVGFDEDSPGKKEDGRSKSRKMRKSVVQSHQIATQPVIALHMEDGTVLRGTPGHRWLGWKSCKNRALQCWMRVDEIARRVAEGRPVVLCRPVKPWKVERDYESGYIAAAFDGEGSICFHKRTNNFGHLAFTQKKNTFLGKVRESLQSKGFELYSQHNGDRGTTQVQIKGGMWAQAEFIGRFDMPRFREKWVKHAPVDGYQLLGHHRARVVRCEDEGIQSIVAIKTSTATYLAEGFCSHNCHELSRFDKTPDDPRYLTEVQMGRQFLAWLRHELPKAAIVWKDGNHEERLFTYLTAKAPALFGLDVLTMSNLMHFDRYKVQHVTDRRVISAGKLHIVHGHEFRPAISAPVNPARGLFLRAKANALCGHHHQSSEHGEPTIGGKQQCAWSVGCACDLAPRYMPLNKWVHGYAMVKVSDSGHFEVRNLKVIDGEVV